MIRKILITVTLGLFTVLTPIIADPVEEYYAGKDLSINTDDYLMPSLAEMLGEPVDDLGYLTENEQLQSDIINYAKSHIGCRYVWGSKGPSTFDCSGFTSYVYKKFGYSLSPSSKMQGTQGEAVSIADAEVGDLIFFSGRKISNTVGHVGMITEVDKEKGKVKFIHASVKKGVTISDLDENYYNQRFISIRHVISDTQLTKNQ
ncbi:MAG: C40 family peptidase [Paramuribaculum sp.]|nr:C40 family peptidase [Paramuribaculum sp.]